MSHWHPSRGGWGQGHGFAGRSAAKKKGGNHVPERWKDYIPVGQRMPGTRFIAFKVPLKKSFQEKLAPEERFSPLDLFNKIQEQNEELGLIIDLTYTQRYYKPEATTCYSGRSIRYARHSNNKVSNGDVTGPPRANRRSTGGPLPLPLPDLPETIPYLKIFTLGHHVPDDKTISKFKCAVSGFLKENKDNDKLIGVHCTHGLNRTGYLICRYLIDVEGMRPDDAIELFNRCRGHCLERQNYIEDLQNGPIRKNWDSSVSRSRGYENSAHMAEPVHTTYKSPKQRPMYNSHQACGYAVPTPYFHNHTQDLQESARKFPQNQNVYQRSYLPPPGPPGEDYSRRRYSWNIKSQANQNTRWHRKDYYGLSYPNYCEWTE